MLKTKKVVEPREVPESMTCDHCGKEVPVTDRAELNEFVCLHRKCHHGSVFGEGAEIHLDLCQDCVKKVLGGLITVVPAAAPADDGCSMQQGLGLKLERPEEPYEEEEHLDMPLSGEASHGNPTSG